MHLKKEKKSWRWQGFRWVALCLRCWELTDVTQPRSWFRRRLCVGHMESDQTAGFLTGVPGDTHKGDLYRSTPEDWFHQTTPFLQFLRFGGLKVDLPQALLWNGACVTSSTDGIASLKFLILPVLSTRSAITLYYYTCYVEGGRGEGLAKNEEAVSFWTSVCLLSSFRNLQIKKLIQRRCSKRKTESHTRRFEGCTEISSLVNLDQELKRGGGIRPLSIWYKHPRPPQGIVYLPSDFSGKTKNQKLHRIYIVQGNQPLKSIWNIN